MKVEYDPTHDILNIEFLPEVGIAESEDYDGIDGIIIDYASDRRIVGLEILDASHRTSADPLDILDVKILRHKEVA